MTQTSETQLSVEIARNIGWDTAVRRYYAISISERIRRIA
jgi:hypothetical protein